MITPGDARIIPKGDNGLEIGTKIPLAHVLLPFDWTRLARKNNAVDGKIIEGTGNHRPESPQRINILRNDVKKPSPNWTNPITRTGKNAKIRVPHAEKRLVTLFVR